ncbi:hypothetical protein FRC12_022185 [Ceratobasidium sp. 428]|nr:hypothetical protein FRC12_022185 [Ceratobasidium sp. 428]
MVNLELMGTIPLEYRLANQNTFNPVEKTWLVDTFIHEFREIDGRKNAEKSARSGKSKDKSNLTSILKPAKSQADVMKAKMLQAFVEQFPYRDPSRKPSPSNPEAVALRAALCWDGDGEWSAAPQRMYDWMQKQKRKPPGQKGQQKTTSRAAVESAGGSKPAVTATTEEDVDELEEEDSPYHPDPAHLSDEKETWQYFMDNTTTAWSAVEPDVLVSRQKRLLDNLEKALRALSRATGAEMAVYGVWEQEGVLKSAEVTTPRANRWLADQSSVITRQEFTRHVARKIGPPICSDVANPAPTIYGDPERGYDAIYPRVNVSVPQHMRLLDLCLRYKWQWGGGRGEVPYELIEEDARSGRYAMTSRERYPPGIDVLVSPYKMSKDDLMAWANHIVAGQEGDIDPEYCWMFTQPQPGKFETETRRHMSSSSKLRFLPESEAYLGFIENRPTVEELADRKDELPVATESAPYLSLSEDRVALLKLDVGSDTIYAELLDELVEHDKSWPVEYPEEYYELISKQLPMLPSKPPSALDELNIFSQEAGGFISPRFHLQDDDENARWRLFSVLSGCAEDQYFHPPSKTLLGGPFGVKWAVLTLCFLRLNELLLERGDIARPNSYDGVNAEITRKDAREVRIAAQSLKKSLYTSRLRLQKSLKDRSYQSEPTGRMDLVNFQDEDVARVEIHALGVWADEWRERGIARPMTAEEVAAHKAPKRPAEHGDSPPKKSQKTKVSGMGRKRAEVPEKSIHSTDVQGQRSSRRRRQLSSRNRSDSQSAEESKSEDTPQDEIMYSTGDDEIEEVESESPQEELEQAGPSNKKQSAGRARQGEMSVVMPPSSSTKSAAPARRSARVAKSAGKG